jgi:hypothetical protein
MQIYINKRDETPKVDFKSLLNKAGKVIGYVTSIRSIGRIKCLLPYSFLEFFGKQPLNLTHDTALVAMAKTITRVVL